MTVQRPTIGRVVHVIGGAAESNGTDVAPANVTRVWSDEMINATVFPDAAAPRVATSLQLFADEAAARAWIAEEQYRSTAAFWPPRA